MSSSPLQLDRYFFVRTILEAQSKGSPDAVQQVNANYQFSKQVDSPNSCVLSLTVKLAPHGDTIPYYTGEFTVVGYFKTAPDLDTADSERLVAVNGSSILYGAVREMVANLTARGPWPACFIAPMNFSEAHRTSKSDKLKSK